MRENNFQISRCVASSPPSATTLTRLHSMHGEMQQKERDAIMGEFRTGSR